MTIPLLIVIFNITLGVIIYIRNPRDRVNVAFLFLAIMVSAWSYASHLTDTAAIGTREFYARCAFVFPMLVTLTVTYLAHIFPSNLRKSGPLIEGLWLIFGLIVVFLSGTSLVSKSIKVRLDGTDIIPGVLYVPYLLTIFGLLLYSAFLYRRQKKMALGVQRQQVRMVAGGLLVSIGWAAIFNAILPLIVSNWAVAKLGPLGSMIFVGCTAYAIVRHKMFDIRLLLARYIAYLLSLGAMLGLYLLVVFGVSRLISIGSDLQGRQRLFYVAMALVFAVSITPLKTIFDKITNKLFFKDIYDPQSILDVVSGVIVGNVDPHKVQSGSLKALSEALQPTYIGFLLMGGNSDLHHGDQIGQHWVVKDPSFFHSSLQKSGKKITIYDELEEASGELREVLRAEDISVVAPLVTKDETIGYLVLGRKKSGNIYNSQDIGLLNIASNELAVALQNAQRFEEIQAFNITLQEKVNEATRELKKTNRKLVALDEAKDEFISMASHQLRTPLTSIKGYLSMLAEGDLGKVTKAQEKAIKEAFGSSQRMVYLIADFLNVSRIKTGKFVIEPKEVDLPMVVSEEITQLREMAGSRDITLQYQAPEVFPKVMLDDNKIRQVMMNIVDNAIYYTAAGGTVTIQLFVDSADVVFKVIDTGIGVPKREQHKLFTKFFRAGNARKARPDGTGLGLFMAQKIIAEQGGSIIFESTEGKGSTFGFRFPLSKIKT